MSWIRRTWTPEAADRWSREDGIAAVLSALGYLLIIIGGTLSLLGSVTGYVVLAAGIGASGLMYWVIDPKLRAISADYEQKQKGYLERVEKLVRWEKP